MAASDGVRQIVPLIRTFAQSRVRPMTAADDSYRGVRDHDVTTMLASILFAAILLGLGGHGDEVANLNLLCWHQMPTGDGQVAARRTLSNRASSQPARCNVVILGAQRVRHRSKAQRSCSSTCPTVERSSRFA